MITIAINENRIASTLGRAFCGDANTQIVVENVDATGLRVALIDPARKVLALCNEFTATGTNAVGTLALNTHELADALRDIPTGQIQRVAFVVYNANGTLGGGFIPVVAEPLPIEITPIPEGYVYLTQGDVLGEILADSTLPVQSKVIAQEIEDIKDKQFAIAVDGIRKHPGGGVVNVPTNYDRIFVMSSNGTAEVEANKVNIIEEWSVGFNDTWIPEIEKPIYGVIYWDEESQCWNTSGLYTDDGFSGAVGIGSLHDDWDFTTHTPKDGFYGYTDLYADYSIEQATATTPIQDVDDGSGYTMTGFVADIVFRNNTTGELRTVTDMTFVAWNGIDDPTSASMSQFETRCEDDGSEWYISELWGVDVTQLIVDDPTAFEPIDITYMFADIYPWVSLRLGFRREQSQELQEILLKTPDAQGVADYIVDITIPDGALDIYIRSENYYGFTSSNAKALALEAGRNLLTFTELNGDFLVNRAMLKEVGV